MIENVGCMEITVLIFTKYSDIIRDVIKIEHLSFNALASDDNLLWFRETFVRFLVRLLILSPYMNEVEAPWDIDYKWRVIYGIINFA